MWQVMVYAVGIAAAMSAAGLCQERLAFMRDLPRRWVWPLAMVLSIAWTVTGILLMDPSAEVAPAVQQIDAAPAPGQAGDIEALAPLTPLANSDQPPRWSPPATPTLLILWACASGAALLYLLGAGALLRRRASRWRGATVLGREVLVSESTGPALLGTLRPRIVVPEWFMTAPPAMQDLILQHEEQHIAARDPLLLHLATLVTVALPWNLPLWWQLARLRQSIEMDCDARVLKAGAAPSKYGQVLLEVTRRASDVPAALIAMSEPVSTLERRIRNLAPDPARHSVVRASAALLVWTAGIGVAAALEAPPLPQRDAPAQRQAAPPVREAGAPGAAETPASRAGGGRTVTPLPRLPKPSVSPRTRDRRQVMEEALVANHPELVNGPERDGTAFVSMQFAADGSIAGSELRFVGAEEAARLATAAAGGTLGPDSGLLLLPRGLKIAGGATVRNQVRVVYRQAQPQLNARGERDPGPLPPADVLAVAEHHFPGAWSGRKGPAEGMPWLVLSPDGRVLRSGWFKSPRISFEAINAEVPDLRVERGFWIVSVGGNPDSKNGRYLALAWTER